MRTSGHIIKPIALVAMIGMAALTFTGFFGLSIAGISVFIGIVFFFVDEGKKPQDSSLDRKNVGKELANPRIWFWIAMPTLMNFICTGLAEFVLPEFTDHVIARTGQFLTFSRLPLLAIQLVLGAVGEEIAWRAFFQKQLDKITTAPVAILVTSVLFSLGHFAGGAAPIVMYDLLFVGINSLFYGIVFQKTNNAWISAIAHLIANISSILFVMFLSYRPH